MRRVMLFVVGSTLSLSALYQASSQTAMTVDTSGPAPAYRVVVTSRTIQAVNYRHRSGASEVGFAGTALLPSAIGTAKVRSKRGTLEVEAEFENLQNPTTFGSEYLTYVLWAISPEGRPVNLGEVVQEELGQLQATATTRSLTLEYKKPKNFPMLMLDETKTRQIIMNFVDNSIYYTPAGGRIKVRLISTPTTIEFRVEDNGMGVPRSEQPHLFTKFYRAGNARKARPDGTGLGLFMAKKVIIAQGGALIFDSIEGKGSTFGFVFSKSKLKPKSSPVTPV